MAQLSDGATSTCRNSRHATETCSARAAPRLYGKPVASAIMADGRLNSVSAVRDLQRLAVPVYDFGHMFSPDDGDYVGHEAHEEIGTNTEEEMTSPEEACAFIFRFSESRFIWLVWIERRDELVVSTYLYAWQPWGYPSLTTARFPSSPQSPATIQGHGAGSRCDHAFERNAFDCVDRLCRRPARVFPSIQRHLAADRDRDCVDRLCSHRRKTVPQTVEP